MPMTQNTPWRSGPDGRGTGYHNVWDSTGRIVLAGIGSDVLAVIIAAAPETAAERDRLREAIENARILLADERYAAADLMLSAQSEEVTSTELARLSVLLTDANALNIGSAKLLLQAETERASLRAEVKRLEQVERNYADDRTAASDHALFASAVCRGVARWERFSGTSTDGEVCVGGMRYSTQLDHFGCPVLSERIQHELAKAVNG